MNDDDIPCVITFADVRDGEVFRHNRTLYRKLPGEEQTPLKNCVRLNNGGTWHFYIDALVIVKGGYPQRGRRKCILII